LECDFLKSLFQSHKHHPLAPIFLSNYLNALLVFLFELEVVDDRAGWTKDTLTVTVNPTAMNLPPVAAAGPDTTSVSLVVNIDASKSYDPDGFVSSYKWRQLSGPSSAFFACTTCSATNISNLANGTYKLEVEVTDNLGAKTKDTLQVMEAGSILPAGILYFKGKNLGSENILQWATVSEFNSDHFEIQRSADGRNFVSIGQVSASGMSKNTKEYKFTDDHAPEKLSYYRLMQVDQDGSIHYSTIVSVNNNKGKWVIETYPNPVVDEMQLQVTGGEMGAMNIRIINQHGQLIRNISIEKHTEELSTRVNLKTLPSGIYFLEIRLGDTVKEIRKVIKE